MGGGGGGGFPISMDGTVAPPTAAGIRSLRLDIPHTGQPFTFTKVLNVSDEPLSVAVIVKSPASEPSLLSTTFP